MEPRNTLINLQQINSEDINGEWILANENITYKFSDETLVIKSMKGKPFTHPRDKSSTTLFASESGIVEISLLTDRFLIVKDGIKGYYLLIRNPKQ